MLRRENKLTYNFNTQYNDSKPKGQKVKCQCGRIIAFRDGNTLYIRCKDCKQQTTFELR